MHILSAAAISLGFRANDITLSHATLHRRREIIRSKMAGQLKENLQVADYLTVHWDGKLLPDLDNKKIIERLPIIISGCNSDQLLGVPRIEGGTAQKQAQSIIETIHEWNLQERIRAMCFDTTNVNSGKLLNIGFLLRIDLKLDYFNRLFFMNLIPLRIRGGVCTLLEKHFDRKLLHFACRHHIYELILRSVTEVCWPATNGPDMPFFKRFLKIWPTINKNEFVIGIKDDGISSALGDKQDEILYFISSRIEVILRL